MSGQAKSLSDQIRACAAAGLTRAAIQAQLGCSLPYISAVLSRDRRAAAAREAAQAAPVVPERDGSILATGGRYRALAEYAAANGVTLRVAQQRWHKARVA